MRWIGYQEAERLCARLAWQLRLHLGPTLPGCRFAAIPRGGLLVLGMLGYLLDLERSQIVSPGEPGPGPLVIVDDCSLSGARFAAALEETDAPRVVFAHLLSHPRLREAVLATEPRVEACLAADDLAEEAPAGGAPRDRAYWQEWRARLPGRRYWLGAVEPLAFAWSEPDRVVWNERAGRIEDDWHRISPRRCLDARVALAVPLRGEDAGPIEVPEHLHWKVEGEQVILWQSTADRVYGLRGVASDMWRSLAAYGDLDAAVEYLAGRYDVDRAELRADLVRFARELEARGLIAGAGEPGGNGA